MSFSAKDTARNSTKRPGSDTVENVQALRGIAALLVVWAHTKAAVGEICPGKDLSWIWSSHGAMGVDLFFVISGFVISLTACKRHHQSGDFMLARVARVSPLYLVYVLTFIFAKAIFFHRFNTFSSIWNGLFYLPIFDWHDLTGPPGGIGWTLCFEMWFYTVFAVLLLMFPPKRVVTALPLLFFLGAPLDFLLYRGDWFFPTFMFHPYTLEFAFGCVIYQVQSLISKPVTWGLIVVALFLLLFVTPQSGDLASNPLTIEAAPGAWRRVLFWGVPMALAAAAFVGLERNRIYNMPGFLVWAGGISYSMYLSHQLTLDIFSHLGSRFGPHHPWLWVTVLPLIAVFDAWLCWKFIEHPLTVRAQGLVKRWNRRTQAPKTAVPLGRAEDASG